MKRSAAVIIFASLFSSLLVGQAINYNASKSNTGNFTITCKGPDGKACTAAHVQAINTGVSVGKRQHKALADVRGLTLGQDGTVSCVQNNGKECTSAQLDAIKEVASELNTGNNTVKPKSNAEKTTK